MEAKNGFASRCQKDQLASNEFHVWCQRFVGAHVSPKNEIISPGRWVHRRKHQNVMFCHCNTNLQLFGLPTKAQIKSVQEQFHAKQCAATLRTPGGSFKNDLESWQEVLERGDCEVENTLACKGLGGEVLKMTWNRDKKSWGGETVKLRLLLHVRF